MNEITCVIKNNDISGKVLNYPIHSITGLIVAIIVVLEFPPKLSFSNQVSEESRYGIC